MLIISFVIYAFFFCNLANTCYRINFLGIKQFNFLPLITEGFIGPIRTLLNLIYKGYFRSAFEYFLHETTNLANPFTTYYIVRYIHNILVKNKIINLLFLKYYLYIYFHYIQGKKQYMPDVNNMNLKF